MSIKLMNQAWETNASGNDLLVLLALCDFSNDDGLSFPSLKTLSTKAKVSKSTLSYILRAYEEVGVITREKRQRDNKSDASTMYKINHLNFDIKSYKKAYQKSRKYTEKVHNVNTLSPQCEHGVNPENNINVNTGVFAQCEHLYEPPVINHQVSKDTKESSVANVCDDAQDVASYLLQKIQKHQPTFKVHNFKTWVRDIDLALRLDGRTKEQLIGCINWIYGTQRGNFWIANVLSGKKLREKFETMRMQSQQKQTQKQNTNAIVDEIYGNGTTAQELIEQMERGA